MIGMATLWVAGWRKRMRESILGNLSELGLALDGVKIEDIRMRELAASIYYG